MMNRHRLLGISIALLASCSVGLGYDKVDDVAKKIDASFDKIKSYSAKFTMVSDSDMGQGNNYHMESKATMEFLRKGDTILSRSDSQVMTIMTMDGKETKTESKITSASDGKFTYILSKDANGTQASKSKAATLADSRPTMMFRALRQFSDITVLDDENVDGKACYVIQTKTKPQEGMPPQGRSVMYFRKDIGLSVKWMSYDANGKVTMKSLTTDLKLNASISESRFKLEIPPGVKVTDLTQMNAQNQQSGQDAQAQEQEAKPAEKKTAKKAEETKKKEAAKKEETKKEEKKKKKRFGLPKLKRKFP